MDELVKTFSRPASRTAPPKRWRNYFQVRSREELAELGFTNVSLAGKLYQPLDIVPSIYTQPSRDLAETQAAKTLNKLFSNQGLPFKCAFIYLGPESEDVP